MIMAERVIVDGDDDIGLEDSIFTGLQKKESEDAEESDEPGLKYDDYYRHQSSSGNDTQQPPALHLALFAKHHSLWAEFIYNAARVLADLIDHHTPQSVLETLPKIDVTDKKCLELGAGAGLPGLMAALCGAREVVISDYGHDFDLSLIYPIDVNIAYVKQFFHKDKTAPAVKVHGVGYVWGYPPDILLSPDTYYHDPQAILDLSSYNKYIGSKLASRRPSAAAEHEHEHDHDQNDHVEKFDIIFLADLIFNRSEHSKLLWTVKQCLKIGSGVCYVTFSHHDPAKASLDLNFFSICREEPYRFDVKYIGKNVRESYPFKEKDGFDDQRGVIYLYELRIPD